MGETKTAPRYDARSARAGGWRGTAAAAILWGVSSLHPRTAAVLVEHPSSARPHPAPSFSAAFDEVLPPGERRVFRLLQRAARQALRRRVRLVRVAGRAYAKLSRHESALQQVRADLLTLVRLVRAWANRTYRGVPWRSMLYGVAALLYFLTPFDAVPDVLLVLGLADDVAVISVVVQALRSDLDRFAAWERGLLPAPARSAGPAPASAAVPIPVR